MTCESSAPMVFAPEPTTLIFASVAAEIRGLNSQKIHVRSVGTLMKNLRDCASSEPLYYAAGLQAEGTYEEPGVVVLEDVRRLLRGGLLARVTLGHAHAFVVW